MEKNSHTARLSSLKPGQLCKIISILPECTGAERRRFMDLGIVPGTVVKAEFNSPSGDPTAYSIRHALIGLRKEQADYIAIEKMPNQTRKESRDENRNRPE